MIGYGVEMVHKNYHLNIGAYFSLSNRANGDLVSPYASALAVMSYNNSPQIDLEHIESLIEGEFKQAVRLGAMVEVKKETPFLKGEEISYYQIIDIDFFKHS